MVTKVTEQPQEFDMLDCDNSIERLIVRFNEFKQPSVYSKGSVVLWSLLLLIIQKGQSLVIKTAHSEAEEESLQYEKQSLELVYCAVSSHKLKLAPW